MAFQETNYVNEWLGMLGEHEVFALLIKPNPHIMAIKSYHSYDDSFVQRIYAPYMARGKKVASVGIIDHIIYTASAFFHISKALRSDVVIYFTPSYFHTLTMPILKIFGKKICVVSVDPQQILKDRSRKSPLHYIYYAFARFLEITSIRLADKVFAVSDYLEKEYKSINKNTYYTPNGADTEYISSIKQNKISKKPAIVFFGSLDKWRGVDLLLDAYKKLPDRDKYSLVFLGGGREEQSLREASRGMDVHVSGFIDHKSAIAICKSAYLLVIPFRDSPILYKTSPIKTFEYIACGVPIVVTNTGKHADTIKNLGAGLVTEPNPEDISKCIKRLVSDKKLYQKIKEHCIMAGKKVGYKNTRRKFVQEINSLEHL